MDKRKQGIALFITLMVIASIMSIIAVSFTYLEKVQKDAGITSAIIQGNLLYTNTVSVLKRFFPKGKDNTEKLKLIYTMPLLLSEPKSGFTLNMSCKPLMIGVPINWLDEKLTKKTPQKSTLVNNTLTAVMDLYEIKEPNELENILTEHIVNKNNENLDYSPRVKRNKGIFSYQEFERIIIDYRLRYDDPKVLTVPWDKYFSFTQITQETKIDGVYLSPEFISIAFDVPLEMVKDSWKIGESTLKKFLEENSIVDSLNKKIYSKKALNAMHCEQSYIYRDGYYKFNFDYIEGRSGNFEFNGEEQ
jgi:hypothetical protein